MLEVSQDIQTNKISQKTLNIDKALSAVAFVCLALVSIIIASTPLASGYELVIYEAYPFCFWLAIIFAITCGICILVRQAFAHHRSQWWISGLSIVVFSNMLVLSLPWFRGYAIYGRFDTLTHLGYIKDILSTGHKGEENCYPIIHILGTQLSHITDISLNDIPFAFFLIFFLVYIVNMYLLAKSVSNSFGQVLLVLAFALPLIYGQFHTSMHPSFLSLFMVPCFLYLCHMREKSALYRLRYTVLVIILAFSITFMHPVSTLFTIVILVTLRIAHTIYSRLKNNYYPSELDHVPRNNVLGIASILFVVFFVWYSSYAIIQRSISSSYEWLVQQTGDPLVETQLEKTTEFGLSATQTIWNAINAYGSAVLLLIISGIAALFVFRNFNKKNISEPSLFIYAIIFLAVLFAGGLEFFGAWGENRSVLRIARFPLLMGIIISGLVLFGTVMNCTSSFSKERLLLKRKVALVVTGGMIIVMAFLSLGGIYHSERDSVINLQVTYEELSGMSWFAEKRVPYIGTVAHKGRWLLRFDDYLFGKNEGKEITFRDIQQQVPPGPYKTLLDHENFGELPSHFGYETYNHLSEAFAYSQVRGSYKYMVFLPVDTVYQEVYPSNTRDNLRQWNSQDFVRLSRDPSVEKLYDNGGFGVWRILRTTAIPG